MLKLANLLAFLFSASSFSFRSKLKTLARKHFFNNLIKYYAVSGIEPNEEMRRTAEELLKGYAKFNSIAGRSEDTHLPDLSVDLITAAQAFHWFEPIATRREFNRILKPGAHVVLVWNDRRSTQGPFAVEYEDLIKAFSTDYEKVNHKNIVEEEIRSFLGQEGYGVEVFYNFQDLDLDGLVGRLASSSYAPSADHPKYPEMVVALRRLFDKHQAGGKVRLEYDTKAYYGILKD